MQSELKIEVIAIGDELLVGGTLDRNTRWIAGRLAENGVRLRWTSIVGDNESDILRQLDQAWGRSNVVLTTGGLGPTRDDITCRVIARFFEDELVTRDDILATIKSRFSLRGMDIPPGTERMAEFPSAAEPIPNEHGSAPGIHYHETDHDLFAMPGVPVEMHGMFEKYVLPRIIKRRRGYYEHRILRTTGIGESHLSAMIGDPKELQTVSLAFLPSIERGVTIRLSLGGADRDDVSNRLNQATALVRSKIESHVYSEGQESLESCILSLLRKAGKKLAVVESCTGGMIAARFVSVPGSSDVFERGYVTYSDSSKIEMVGVREETLREHGAVSEETAMEMASGARERAKVDYALSVTGVAGPGGGTVEKPVGLVYIGLADNERVIARKHHFVGDRNENRRRSTNAALTLLWRRLRETGTDK